MRAFLIALLAAAPAGAQDARQAAQTSVANTVVASLPPGTQPPAPGQLGDFLSRLPPDQRQAALSGLTQNADGLPQDAATQSTLASAYMDLNDPQSALAAAQRALAQDPRNGDALAAQARALKATGDVQGAIAAYRQIPQDSPQYPVAVAQLQLLGNGPRNSSGASYAPASVAPSGTASSAAMYTTGDPVLDHRMQTAFARGQDSPTFQDTVRRFDPNATTLADLQQAGIGIQVGPADMKTSVQVIQQPDGNGGTKEVIQFSPSVLNNSHSSRVAAQLGRGIEQARTTRDDNWLSAWIANLGGRIVAVKVHGELDPNDTEPAPNNTSDAELMRDAAVVNRQAGTAFNATGIAGAPPSEDTTMLAKLTGAMAPGAGTVDLLLRFTRSVASYGNSQPIPQATDKDNAYLTELKNRGL